MISWHPFWPWEANGGIITKIGNRPRVQNTAGCVLNWKSEWSHSLENNRRGSWRSRVVPGVLDSDRGRITALLSWDGLRMISLLSPGSVQSIPRAVNKVTAQKGNQCLTSVLKKEIKACPLVQTLGPYHDRITEFMNWEADGLYTIVSYIWKYIETSWRSC